MINHGETRAKLDSGNMLRGNSDEFTPIVPTDHGVPNGEKIKIKVEVKMNPDDMGLAQSQGQAPITNINQIVALLMQGMNPDELVQQGVPVELVQAAIEQISKQMTQVPNEQAGLAATVVSPSGM